MRSHSKPKIICCAFCNVFLIFFPSKVRGNPSGLDKNPVKRLFKGLYGLYGMTSYLSDILSYSRLLALGLATGVIGQVFNQIACLGGNTPVGIVLFIIVFA